MNKSANYKKYLPPLLFLSAVIILLLVILVRSNPAVWIPNLFRTLFYNFVNAYRSKIVYLIVFILAAALIFLPVRRMLRRFYVKEALEQ
jgi:hypothetical protein